MLAENNFNSPFNRHRLSDLISINAKLLSQGLAIGYGGSSCVTADSLQTWNRKNLDTLIQIIEAQIVARVGEMTVTADGPSIMGTPVGMRRSVAAELR